VTKKKGAQKKSKTILQPTLGGFWGSTIACVLHTRGFGLVDWIQVFSLRLLYKWLRF